MKTVIHCMCFPLSYWLPFYSENILLTISLLKYSFFCFNDEAMKTDGYYILKMFLFVKVKKSATQ